MNFINKYKKLLICLIIGIILGFGSSANAFVSKEDFNTLLSKKETIEKKISDVESLINKENNNVESLKKQKASKEEEDKKAKLESERLAKEEADKKAKLESERLAKEETDKKAKLESERLAKQKESNTYSAKSSSSNNAGSESKSNVESMVWLSETGKKYHNKNNCGRMNPNNARQIERSKAEAAGFGACKKCF